LGWVVSSTDYGGDCLLSSTKRSTSHFSLMLNSVQHRFKH
jgi:hypothetical protein